MQQLTIEEIVEYAVHIEKESLQFYKEASEKFKSDESLRSLTDELAEQELGHIEHLKGLLKNKEITVDRHVHTVNVDRAFRKRIVPTRTIPEDATPHQVLEIALRREVDTRETYAMFLDLTRLDARVMETFTRLKEMEQTHIEIISERVRNLKGR